MLEQGKRVALLDRLGLPDAGRRLVLDAAKFAPVRRTRSQGGGNVVTEFQSRKMGRPIVTASRHLEFPVALMHEHDPDVLEYYPQPCRLKFEVVDEDGEIHTVDHTPDYLVITPSGVWLEECKFDSKLRNLAKRYPWRYRLGPDDTWTAPLIEAWLAKKGIGYRFRTDQDIPRQRVENYLHLEDYLLPDSPACPVNVEQAIRELLVEEPVLFLADLYERAMCRPDDAFKLIADGLLVADLDGSAITSPNRCRVFRDLAVRDFEAARQRPKGGLPAGVLSLRQGARLRYDQRPYTVTLVGAERVVLTGDTDETVELKRRLLGDLAAKGILVPESEGEVEPMAASLADCSDSQLKAALERHRRLAAGDLPDRTARRLGALVNRAEVAGEDALLALVPRTPDRGNRVPRLLPEQEDAMAKVIRDDHLTAKAPNVKASYRRLRVYCLGAGITAPSYRTFCKRVGSIPQPAADMARHGKRVAYQNAEFIPVLCYEAPVHGSRPLQYIHMDHTELDIELVSSRTHKPLRRPWLSLAVCSFSRRIVGFFLSFDPPSYRSNMMLLRDIVRRHQRLPQAIVVDNGADFRSNDFATFCRVMGIHLRYRPAGQPRFGTVLERLFGRLHTEYIHNLAGNTKATKAVRLTTGKHLPSRLAEWNLEQLDAGIEYWATEHYDTATHPALEGSPRESFERGLAATGIREHRIVVLNRDFLILTCPTAGRAGTRRVDRQRGIKVNDHLYWCPEMADPLLQRVPVPVRYDPWDVSTVYIRVGGRWLPAKCRALQALVGMTEEERKSLSAEYGRRFRQRDFTELNDRQLVEFLRTFEPTGALALELERQAENRHLYNKKGLGAVSAGEPTALLDQNTRARVVAAAEDERPSRTVETRQFLVSPSADVNRTDDDYPDFDTF